MLFKNFSVSLGLFFVEIHGNPWKSMQRGNEWYCLSHAGEKWYLGSRKKCHSSPLKTTNHDRYWVLPQGKNPLAEDNASRDTGKPRDNLQRVSFSRQLSKEKWGAVRKHIKKCLAVMTRSFRREEQSSLLRESSFEPSTVSLFANFSSYDEPRSEGYDEYFDPPLESKYECPICLLGLREPVQTSCGHRFCKGCILRSIR